MDWTQATYLLWRERHRGWSLSPLTSQARLFHRAIGRRPFCALLVFRFANFSPAFLRSLSLSLSVSSSLSLFPFRLIAVNFLGKGHSNRLTVIRDNKSPFLWWLAWAFRATILVLSCLDGERSSYLVVVASRHTRNSALIFELNPNVLVLYSSRSWRAQDVDNEEIFREQYTPIGSMSRSAAIDGVVEGIVERRHRFNGRRNCRVCRGECNLWQTPRVHNTS